MKIVLFARTLESTQLCKISQEFGLLSNFGNLLKIRNAHFGRCGPLEVNLLFQSKCTYYLEIELNNSYKTLNSSLLNHVLCILDVKL